MKNKTKGIGFKNFRRFEDFPMLDFGEITYMVGRNNSGKSTMVKALLLVQNYLKNQLSDTFSFDNEVLEDANIVTFGRAKCNLIDKPVIVFELKLDNYLISIRISGNDDKTSAKVDYFSVSDKINGFNLEVNYIKNIIRVIKNSLKFDDENKAKIEFIKNVKEEIKQLTKSLTNISVISKDGLKITDRINKLNDQLKKAIIIDPEQAISSIDFDVEYPINIDSNIKRTEDNELKELISVLLYNNSIEYKKIINKRDEIENDLDFDDNYSDVIGLYNFKDELNSWIDSFVLKIELEEFYYLGANPSKQTALFPLRSKENALAQAIHEYYQLGVQEGDYEYEFIKDWMSKFEVGDGFEIEFYAGEAYEFHVFKQGKKNHLSDKGMGSLQAMMLILKVASLIKKNKKNKKNITLLVEEPELNLHPALQSKLTEFFHEVNKKDKFNFIIETHSEYMIRKSQVLTNKEEYEGKESLNPNPFKTFYFPIDENPYEMRYRKDGKFMDEFKKGFFEVSSDLAFDIL